jgi:hypothetical protein
VDRGLLSPRLCRFACQRLGLAQFAVSSPRGARRLLEESTERPHGVEPELIRQFRSVHRKRIACGSRLAVMVRGGLEPLTTNAQFLARRES